MNRKGAKDPGTIYQSYPGEIRCAPHYREFHRAQRGRREENYFFRIGTDDPKKLIVLQGG